MTEQERKIFDYPTNTPIKFWLKYWDYRVQEFCDLNDFGLKVENPHLLICEILSEIKYNAFSNKDNRILFKALLSECLRKDPSFSSLYHKECAVAFKEWDTAPLFVNTLLGNVLRSMEEHKYLESILERIINLVDRESPLDSNFKKQICQYTDLLITELIALGVDANDIKGFINDDCILMQEGGKVLRAKDTFYELKRDDFPSEESYYEAVANRYKTRTAQEYLNNLKKHYYTKPEDAFVLLRLDGLKGSTNIMSQGIHLYSIDQVHYLKEPTTSHVEKPNNNFVFINAAVPVKHKFLNTSITEAKNKLNHLIDFLSLNLNQEISISEESATIVVDGIVRCSTMHNPHLLHKSSFYWELKSVDVGRNFNIFSQWFERFGEMKVLSDEDMYTIANACHWYKKAVNCERPEDKLLYSWIAIESVLKSDKEYSKNIIGHNADNSILNLAKVICSAVIVRNKFYSYASNVYKIIIDATQDYNNYYDFSPEVIEKANLNLKRGMRLPMNLFFENLSLIIQEMNDEVFKIEVEKVNDFYISDAECKEYKKDIWNDLILIYRLRNLIAHNATCSEFYTRLYAYKAQFICESLIHAIQHYCLKFGKSIKESLLLIHTDYEMFVSEFENHLRRMKS